MRVRILARTLPFVVVALSVRPAATPQRGLSTDGGRFMLDGKPVQVISGEMHYARVPREYWRDRLRKARAMGLNTISTYVFWNLHETVRGRYDFTDQKDVATFVRLAAEEGLHVIVRPGPYVCAEWDLGGYPAWLLADPDLVLRSTDPKFTAPAAQWLDRLGRELAPLLAPAGPIVAVQVENEYGSFDRDAEYLDWQMQALRHAGFAQVFLYTADGDAQLPNGSIPGVHAVVNFGTGSAEAAFRRLADFRPGAPGMSGEYWAGWFDHWGRPHQKTNLERQARELEWMLTRGYSVNLYMFHGGTTFGFMNGANIDRGRYLPQTTSYDYDAALDESGRLTPKYFAFREVIGGYRPALLPRIPASDSPIAIPPFPVEERAPLAAALGSAVRAERPRNMESYGQSYGFILYRTRLTRGGRGDLVATGIRDYGQVFVDGRPVGSIDRRLQQDRLPLDVAEGGATLELLVENSGRVNFAKALREERKGLTAPVTFAGDEPAGWDVFPLPLSAPPRAGYTEARQAGAAFHRGTFRLASTGDTFLDMRGWGKGTVWINGHHLGRFWSIGPQQSLYVPGPWLKRGLNEVVVFSLTPPATHSVQGLTHPIYELPSAPASRATAEQVSTR